MAKLADDIDEQIDRAILQARDFEPDEQAISIRYLQSEDLFLLLLSSGVRLAIPREDLQDVSALLPEDAATVELRDLNTAVEWPAFHISFGVKGLADGLRGNGAWMDELAQRNRKTSISVRALSSAA